VGTWETEEKVYSGGNYRDIITFFSNGTFQSTFFGSGSISGTWELKDGEFAMNYTIEILFDYSFTNNDNILTLIPLEGEGTEVCHRLLG